MTVSSTPPSGAPPPLRLSTTRFASAIRVTCRLPGSGPPACSAAGPQSVISSVSTCASSTGIPCPDRKESIIASAWVMASPRVSSPRWRLRADLVDSTGPGGPRNSNHSLRPHSLRQVVDLGAMLAQNVPPAQDSIVIGEYRSRDGDPTIAWESCETRIPLDDRPGRQRGAVPADESRVDQRRPDDRQL